MFELQLSRVGKRLGVEGEAVMEQMKVSAK